MSQENVEVVRRCTEALNRALRDPNEWAPYLEFLAADFEYRPEGGPEDIRSYSRGEIRRYAETWLENWGDLRWELEKAIEVGPEQVFGAFRICGQGKRTGLSLEMQIWVIYTVRDGKLVLMKEFRERAEALEAAGLSE